MRHEDVEELYAFSSERKMASVLIREADGLLLYNKACAATYGLFAVGPSTQGPTTFFSESCKYAVLRCFQPV